MLFLITRKGDNEPCKVMLTLILALLYVGVWAHVLLKLGHVDLCWLYHQALYLFEDTLSKLIITWWIFCSYGFNVPCHFHIRWKTVCVYAFVYPLVPPLSACSLPPLQPRYNSTAHCNDQYKYLCTFPLAGRLWLCRVTRGGYILYQTPQSWQKSLIALISHSLRQGSLVVYYLQWTALR